MKKIYIVLLFATMAAAGTGYVVWSKYQTAQKQYRPSTKPPKRTRIEEAVKLRIQQTKDPATGEVPTERMFAVYERIEQIKKARRNKDGDLVQSRWRERGPYNVAGRTRAILIDKGDPSGNTIYTAGVTGGLWKTTNITSSPPNWKTVNDYFDNLNISAIAQNPTNPNVIFFGTGEPHGGAGRGLGMWKTEDGGQTWSYLTATKTPDFRYVVRLFVHPNGDVYAGTEGGLYRSKDNGAVWVKVLGFGVSGGKDDITDIELAVDGALYVSAGHNTGNSAVYKSVAGATLGDIGAWQNIAANGFPGGTTRIELACAPSDANTIYALTAQGGDAEGIYRSSNGGQTWVRASNPPSAVGMDNFTRGQAWYDLTIAVAPTDKNYVIIGGIDLLRSTNGGVTWTQVSQWFGGSGLQYVHADQHEILFDKDRPDVVYFGNDGGIWRSTNKGVTIRDRNDGYNVTQFYACAMHPDKYSNYFLAGAQDNGSQQFDDFGIATTKEVLGGDGFYCHIDQNEPQYQLVSLYFGEYVLSNDGGKSFGAGGINIGASFLNPSDYDNNANILYAEASQSGYYYRWDISQPTGTQVLVSNLSSLGAVVHVQVSPNVANRIYLGLSNDRIAIVDNAHTGTSKTATLLNLPSVNGTVSSIAIQKGNENHLIATFSNFGVTSVWESNNGGLSWGNIEGDLPDMPVNWAIFHPQDPDKLFLATDAGIWSTEDINASTTKWLPCLNGMPSVRTDMLQHRESDNTILAGTHGRGLFTTDFLAPAAVRFEVPTITYTNAPLQFKDQSINARKWSWNFGDGSSTSTLEQPVHTYSALGTYTVTLTINDTLSAQSVITVLPDRPTPYQLGSANYDGDFEKNTDFGVYTPVGTPFERGKSTITGKSGTKSGNYAWVTGIQADYYENYSHSMLYTPNFDLSEKGIYELSFWSKHNLQYGWDGFMVEYSLDKGQSWKTLGEQQTDWYNYTYNEDFSGAFNRGTPIFTGISSDFKQYRIGLAELEGQPNVAFRFAFRANESNTARGVTIDDVVVRKYTDILQTQLIEFVAAYSNTKNDVVDINWTTLPEYRCKGFKVQYSQVGKFTQEGTDYTEYPTLIAARGSSADPSAYAFSPTGMKRDLYFFRLKVLDLDDNFFYSDIVVVKRGEYSSNELTFAAVFPNPFTNYLDITFTQNLNQTIRVRLFDAAGKQIIDKNIVPNGTYIRLETDHLQRGTYLLQVIAGETTLTKKVIKSN